VVCPVVFCSDLWCVLWFLDLPFWAEWNYLAAYLRFGICDRLHVHMINVNICSKLNAVLSDGSHHLWLATSSLQPPSASSSSSSSRPSSPSSSFSRHITSSARRPCSHTLTADCHGTCHTQHINITSALLITDTTHRHYQTSALLITVKQRVTAAACKTDGQLLVYFRDSKSAQLQETTLYENMLISFTFICMM